VKNKVHEALVITMEECGELIQSCSKVIRTKQKSRKYVGQLQDEIGDVVCMIEILKMSGLVTDEMIEERKNIKKTKLKRWSHIFDEEESSSKTSKGPREIEGL